MPYLHLDLPGTYPVEVKRELATRLCMLYALVMETGKPPGVRGKNAEVFSLRQLGTIALCATGVRPPRSFLRRLPR